MKRGVIGFAYIACALSSGCVPEAAMDANKRLKLSLASPVESFSSAIGNLENEYRSIGVMSLAEIKAVAILDQEVRRVDDLVRDSDLYPSEQTPLTGRISLIMFKNDGQKSRELLDLKPPGRWFNAKELSPKEHQSAWLIVQHGDPETQVALLPELVAAAREGVLKASDVAMLADRVEVGLGRPQIYGTQLSCVGNQGVFPDVIDPINIDKRRQHVGLRGTYVEYKARLLSTDPC